MSIKQRVREKLLSILGGICLRESHEILYQETEHLFRELKKQMNEQTDLHLTLHAVADELEQTSNEIHQFKSMFKKLVNYKPVLVVLEPSDRLIRGDFIANDGQLKTIPPAQIGQVAGPFGLFIRKV